MVRPQNTEQNTESFQSQPQDRPENPGRLQTESLKLRSDIAPSTPSAANTLAKEIEFDVRMMNDPTRSELWTSVKKNIDEFRDDKGGKLDLEIAKDSNRTSAVFTDKKGNQGMIAEISPGIVAIDNGKQLTVLDTVLTDLNFSTGTATKDIHVPRGKEVASTLLEMSTALERIGDEQAGTLRSDENVNNGKLNQSSVDRLGRIYTAAITSFELSMKASGMVPDGQSTITKLDNAAQELAFPGAEKTRADFMEKSLALRLQSKPQNLEQITQQREQLVDTYLGTNEFDKARGHLQKLNDDYAKAHPETTFDQQRVKLVSQLALAEAHTGNLDSAESLLASLSKQDSTSEKRQISSTHRYLAKQFQDGNQTERGEEHFKQAAQYSPTHGTERPLAYGGLANMYAQSGRPEEAAKAFDKFIAGMADVSENRDSSGTARALRRDRKEIGQLLDSCESFLSSREGSQSSSKVLEKIRANLQLTEPIN